MMSDIEKRDFAMKCYQVFNMHHPNSIIIVCLAAAQTQMSECLKRMGWAWGRKE